MNEERRLEWIDIAKGLGIVLVVYGHVYRGLITVGMETATSPLGILDYAIYSFHMPLFFFLSGLLVRLSLAKGTRRFWSSKLLYLVYPYFLWSVLQLGMQMAFARFSNHQASAGELIGLLWAPPQQFWFLYVLFWCLVLFAMLQRASNAVLLAIAAGLFVAHFFVDFGVVTVVMWAFLYLALGVALAETVPRFHPSAGLTALLWVAFAAIVVGGVAANLTASAAVPASLCGIAATIASSRRLTRHGKLLRLLGYFSMSIYVMHIMAVAPVRTLLFHFGQVNNVPVQLLAGTIAGLALPVLAHLLLRCAIPLRWLGLANDLRRPGPGAPPSAPWQTLRKSAQATRYQGIDTRSI